MTTRIVSVCLAAALCGCAVVPDDRQAAISETRSTSTEPPAPEAVATSDAYAALYPDRPAEGAAPATVRAKLEQGGWLIGQASPDTVGIVYKDEAVEIAPDGSFLIGFDRDADRDVQIAARYRSGTERRVSLNLAAGQWDLQHVNVSYTAGTPSAEFQRRRAGELDRIEAARKKITGASGWRQEFIWPVRGRISGVFGSQRVYQGKPGPYHGGLDIAVPTGTEFAAPADGVVILATPSPFTLEGYLLMIDHGAGLNSAFLHCSEILVDEGEVVRQGDVIGRVGATGRATGPHLHWGLKWRDARLDPLLFVDR